MHVLMITPNPCPRGPRDGAGDEPPLGGGEGCASEPQAGRRLSWRPRPGSGQGFNRVLVLRRGVQTSPSSNRGGGGVGDPQEPKIFSGASCWGKLFLFGCLFWSTPPPPPPPPLGPGHCPPPTHLIPFQTRGIL